MSLIQFWRILWARRWLILGVTVFCVLGGVAAVVILPPRWRADAHVYLNLLKPDPVTGEVISGPSTRAYVATQQELITDYSVTGMAVDKLGWLTDPNLIQQYQNRASSDTRDFRHWLAQLITDRTKADILDGSNILEINYTGASPDSVKAVADALMQSYLETSLAFKRADATRNADWYRLQAAKTKAALEAAQSSENVFERDNNVVMQDDKTDVDTAHVAAMVSQSAMQASSGGGVDAQIAQIKAKIKTEQETLGANHPELQSQQAQLAELQSVSARAHASDAQPKGSNLEMAKAALIGKRDKLAKLRNLQSQVDVLRDLYSKTEQKEADFRQQAAVTDAGLTALGNASVPQSPSFPNIPLILGGSFALGFAMGCLLALLVELLRRRVRGPEDLRSSLDVPVLTVLEGVR